MENGSENVAVDAKLTPVGEKLQAMGEKLTGATDVDVARDNLQNKIAAQVDQQVQDTTTQAQQAAAQVQEATVEQVKETTPPVPDAKTATAQVQEGMNEVQKGAEKVANASKAAEVEAAQAQAAENINQLNAQKEATMHKLEATKPPSPVKDGFAVAGVSGAAALAADKLLTPIKVAKGVEKAANNAIAAAPNDTVEQATKATEAVVKKLGKDAPDALKDKAGDVVKSLVEATPKVAELAQPDSIRETLATALGLTTEQAAKFSGPELQSTVEAFAKEAHNAGGKAVEAGAKAGADAAAKAPGLTDGIKQVAEELGVEASKITDALKSQGSELSTAQGAVEAANDSFVELVKDKNGAKGIGGFINNAAEKASKMSTGEKGAWVAAAVVATVALGYGLSKVVNSDKVQQRAEMKSQVQMLDERIAKEQQYAAEPGVA